jgi:hypothetical protein
MKKDQSKSNLSVNTSFIRGLNGAASPRSLGRDTSTKSLRLPAFLNPAGPGDYDLKSHFGSGGPKISIKHRLPIPKTRDFVDVNFFLKKLFL